MNEDKYPIYPSSSTLQSYENRLKKTAKYPWQDLEIGQSFCIPAGDAKMSTMQSLASKAGKKLKRKFRVVDHGEGGIEVGRVEPKGNEIEFLKTSVDRGR